MEQPFLKLNIAKIYPGFEMKVAASISAGITAIFGPSGSGKTTILDCIAGLRTIDEGEILLNQQMLASSDKKVNLRPEERRVGYMFQEGLLFPHYRVRENIYYGYKRTPPELRRVQPDQLIDILDLGLLLDRRPANLSAGEQQRVALARAASLG